MNNTISNQTCTKCQNCGEWTNYADDGQHVARMARMASYELALNEIAERTGSDDRGRNLVDIARRALSAGGVGQ